VLIGEVAREAGVTRDAVRLYTRLGLVACTAHRPPLLSSHGRCGRVRIVRYLVARDDADTSARSSSGALPGYRQGETLYQMPDTFRL
jgi:hypothetical protein